MARFLLVLLLEIIAFTAVAVWVLRQAGLLSGTVVGLVCFGGIVLIVATVFHLLWRPMLKAFPPRQPAPDAVRRRFQSFGLGIVNMGFSIHVAADDEYLHLVPLAIWRSLGARPASIPWSSMKPVGKSKRVVRVNGHRLDGPKWCMELAFPRQEKNDV